MAYAIVDEHFDVLPSVPGEAVLSVESAERTIHELMAPRPGCRILGFTLRIATRLPKPVVTQLKGVGCAYGMESHIAQSFTDYDVLCFHRYEHAL